MWFKLSACTALIHCALQPTIQLLRPPEFDTPRQKCPSRPMRFGRRCPAWEPAGLAPRACGKSGRLGSDDGRRRTAWTHREPSFADGQASSMVSTGARHASCPAAAVTHSWPKQRFARATISARSASVSLIGPNRLCLAILAAHQQQERASNGSPASSGRKSGGSRGSSRNCSTAANLAALIASSLMMNISGFLP